MIVAAERPTARKPGLVALVVAVAAMALLPVGVTGTNLAFPEIEAGFGGASRATLSWALSGYSIVIAAFTLLGGQLTDRFDGRRMFRIGLIVFAAASLLAGWAPTVGLLIAGRCLQGIGGALLVSSSLLVATTGWPRERHTFVIGVWTAAFPIGSALAPSVTAGILEIASWRWIFLTTALLALVVLAVEVVALPKAARDPSDAVAAGPFEHPDYLGIVVGTGAVGLAALGIVQGPNWGWTSVRIVAALLVAAALVPVFILRSKRHPRPLLDLELFSIRTFWLANVANVFVSVAGMSVWLIWPLLMINQWGYSQITVGLAITPTPFLAGLGAVVSARIAERTGYRGILLLGMSVIIAANLWFVATLETEPNFVGAMLPGLLLYGIGMGLTFSPINAAALSDVPFERYAQGNAAFSTGRFLAGAIGIAAVVAALGEPGSDPLAGYDRAFAMLALVSAAGFALLALGWPRRATTVAQ